MTPPFSPSAWQSVHRLHEAGCPLDLSYLRRRYAPVQVFSRSGEVEFFGVQANPFYFQLHLQMVAQNSATITRLDIEAEWLPGKVEWAKKCQEHRRYCLHPHYQQYPDDMLQNWLLYHRYRLKAGVCIEGFVAGRCLGKIPQLKPGVPLPATFLVYDGNGYQFEFPLQVRAVVADNLPSAP